MMYQTFRGMMVVFVMVSGGVQAEDCPSHCICTEKTRTVNCTSAGLITIPTIPSYAQKIILSMNSITEVGDKAFASAPSTNYIDLRHNLISKIGGFAFSGISNLEILYMNQNQLKDDVDLTSLSGAGKLTDVYLSFNHFTKIPAIQSVSVRKVVLDGNNIMSANFPDSYKLNSLLQSVVLSHNVIGSISSTDFSNLPSTMTSLDMKLNSITEIDPAALTPVSSSLQTLNLDDNQLTETGVMSALNGLAQAGIPALLVLSLNRNKITKIDAKFFQSLNNGALRNLQMDSNIISSIDPSAFLPLRNTLKLLSLRKCGLSEISFDVSKFSYLIQLAIDGNHLASLPLFLPLSLERLTASNNLISGWNSSTFNGLSTLTALDLSSNRLRTIDNAKLNTSLGAVLNSNTLQQLNLDKNPFNCSCDLVKFLKWANVKENTKKIKNFKNYQCVSPPEWRGKFVKNFNVSKCNSKRSTSLIGIKNLLSNIFEKLSTDRHLVVEIKTVSVKRMDIVYLFLMIIAALTCYLVAKQLLKRRIEKNIMLRHQSEYAPISDDVSVKNP